MPTASHLERLGLVGLCVQAMKTATFWMPTIPQYMAMAEALHDNDETCNANYYHPFSSHNSEDEDGLREYFIGQAIDVLNHLRLSDWHMVRKDVSTPVLGI